jgi:hypothetical protein
MEIMELASVRIAKSPYGRGRVRLVGDVIYDDRRAKPEQYWFDVPEAYGDSLSVSGNPWLACLLPLAVTRGEPLRLCRPIDPVLSQNAARLMQIWVRWYPRLRIVPIDAEVKPVQAGTGPRETAAFFSGGVDSFFTVLRDRESRDRTAFPVIDRLLCVWGFDVGLDTPEEFERLRSRLSEAARDLGKEFIDVATNLREVRFREADWGPHAHGCALASVGLALEPRFPAVYIAATYTGDAPIRPWGSHPETDPLLSTSHTRIIHDGAGIGRWEKTDYIARSDVAMRSLHVCPRARSSENCCNCRKCYLTMSMLEISGALSRCSAFRRQAIDTERVKRIFLGPSPYEYRFREIEVRARAAGREDIAEAIAHCLDRTRHLKRLLPPDWLKTKRGLWRVASMWRKAVLANSVE